MKTSAPIVVWEASEGKSSDGFTATIKEGVSGRLLVEVITPTGVKHFIRAVTFLSGRYEAEQLITSLRRL